MEEKRTYKPRKPGGGRKKLKPEYNAGENLKEQMETGSDEKSYSGDITISGIGLVSNLATKYKIFNA